MGGGTKSAPFFAGTVVLQPTEAIDAFVNAASAGAEFVYCAAPKPMYGESWSRAGELARDGVVRTHQRLRQGGGFEYYMVRTGKALPSSRARHPHAAALADRATAAIFARLKRAANFEQPCPTDTKLAEESGLSSRDAAQWRVRKLIDAGLISSTLHYQGGVPTRVITICETKHSGTAGGKSTAMPSKWAALQRAAARDAGAGK